MNFDELFTAYHRQMLFVARRILENAADAEDAVQNALLKLYRLRDSIPQDPRIRRAYVLTAAKHAALDLKEQEKKTINIDELVLSAKEDVFEEITSSEDYDGLLQAINCLPDRYRDVLMLRYVQELTVEQIARLLGQNVWAVRKRLTRGKALFQKLYERRSQL
ncbi:MAG: sigma-70 family RNA polymerase sigma factor [Oscillospiraceae bacterium]|nr:sigma-70 family RNA polymerase sigma factor [Oscillospiraceae bacterium]